MTMLNLRLTETANKIKSRDRETGVSLVEILVYIILFSIVAVMTVAIISNTVSSSNRFTESSTTQTQVNQSASSLQRDISLANTITFASATRLEFRTRQDNADWDIKVFEYIPGSTTQYPTGTIIGDLPPYNAIIQIRTNLNTGVVGQSVLVQGVTPSDATRELFRYFSLTNSQISNTTTADSLTSIARVEFNIVATASGRASNIELRSSATPSYTLPPGVQASNLLATVPECPPNFNTQIEPRSTQATLSWNAPSGATSYTIYRYNQNNSNALERTEVFPNPNTTSWVDTNLAWGTTYRYAIQASGPGGTTAQCASSISTVVPNQIGFANLNALQQSLTGTKSGTGAETLTAPPVAGIASATAATQNILPGSRYTVARNLTNQLAWESTFGATRYNVYVQGNPTPVAQISAGVLFWQHTTQNFGNVTSYIVRAENAGGESNASATVTLTSPPAASSYSGTNSDVSTRAATTDSLITVTNRAANTVGYTTDRVSVLTASANCSNATYYPSSNFSSNNVTDADSPWGSANCYRFTPFNAAGEGPTSAGITINQLPGKFTVRDVVSTQYQWINESMPVPVPSSCWVDQVGNAGAVACFGGSHSAGNTLPVGFFSRVDNRKTDVTVNWNQSFNSFAGYRVERNRIATGGTIDQVGSASGNSSYVNGVQSLRFNNEMPGSLYNFRVVAIAANGLERTNVSAQHLTSPDIPSFASSRYQIRSASSFPSTYARIVMGFNASATRGMVNGFIATIGTPAGTTTANYGPGGYTEHADGGYTHGNNSRLITSTLSHAGFFAASKSVGKTGFTTPGCGSLCTANWGEVPEKYPVYWSGTFSRYHAGGAFASGTTVPGNPNALPAPTGPVAQPEGSGGAEGASLNCAVLSEGSAQFSNESCPPGSGIPLAPTNLRIATQDATNVTIAWNAVTGASGYVLAVTTGGVTSNFTQPGLSRVIPAPAAGQSISVRVQSYNTINDSPPSNALTVSTGLATPANLRYVSGNTDSGIFAWDAVPGAASYQLRITQAGATNTVTTTSLSQTISLGAGITTQIEVRAINGSIVSPYSASLVRVT